MAGSRSTPTPIRPRTSSNTDRWQLRRAGEWRQVEVEEGQGHGKGVLAKLEGIETPEDARMRTRAARLRWRREAAAAAGSRASTTGAISRDSRRRAASGEPLGRVDHFRTTPGGTSGGDPGRAGALGAVRQGANREVDLDAGRDRARLGWPTGEDHAHRSGDAVSGVRGEAVRIGVVGPRDRSAAESQLQCDDAARIRDGRAPHGRRPAVRRRAGNGAEDRADAHGDPCGEGAVAGREPQRVSRRGWRAR